MSFYWLQELGSNLIKNLLNCLTYSQIPLLDDPVHLHNKIGKEKKEKKKTLDNTLKGCAFIFNRKMLELDYR
jgi:hypothetical protein